MAAKSTLHYLCSECGWSGTKWYGRCPECGEWGTVNEFHEPTIRSVSQTSRTLKNATRTHNTTINGQIEYGSSQDPEHTLVEPITHVQADQYARLSTGSNEFDRVLGGGLVPGSVTLIAGEPGIGKSTLLLETAGNVARHSTKSTTSSPVLYISAEESKSQVKLRASRIHALHDRLLLASTTDLTTVLDLIEHYQPLLAIVDSAQTIVSGNIDGITGGGAQVREVASALIDIAKTYNIPILLVGHVTKDGSIAGPRTLEHLVDTVCQFEGDPQTALRLLRAVKNRFGPTDEVGCFDMNGDGIAEVRDPSSLFLSSHNEQVAGTCVTFTVEGHRSLAIEIQALTTASVLPTARRAVSGIDTNRLAMLTAVLYRHGRINLLSNDLYVSTIAGAQAKEPACDLAIIAALASAALNKPLPALTCAIGEMSLTGQVRPIPRLEARLREASRLGYRQAIVYPNQTPLHVAGMRVIEVHTIHEALQALGLHK